MGEIRLKRFTPSGRCLSCRYSVQNKKFHQDLLGSTYFDENGLLSVSAVMKKHKVPKNLTYRNVMNHVARHLAPIKRHNDEKKALVQVSQEELAKAIAVPDSKTAYERALDDTIDKFHEQLKNGKLKLTVNTGLQAIKIKADMESKNKDRKLDVLKAFSSMGHVSE